MKRLLFLILDNLYILGQLFAQSDTLHSGYSSPISSRIVSANQSQITGQINIDVWFLANDTIVFSNSQFSSPENWTIMASSLENVILLPGDSAICNLVVNHPSDALSYFPEEISIKQFVNPFYDPVLNDTIYESTKATAKIYFTPYNTIEIWNLSDFNNLNRRWLSTDEVPDAQRIYVNPANIPMSNLDNYSIDWDSGDWEDDWKDDFREIEIDGLAYSVLMLPVSPDSMDYYNGIGDGADSLDTRKTFSGTVSGRLVANYQNEYGEAITLPLAGIRVKLMEKDLLWDQTFATGYTDSNGNFVLSYSESQAFEGNLVELFIRFKSRTSDEYKIRSTNFVGSHYKANSAQWQASENAGSMDIGSFILVGFDAFKAVHWANNGYKYFDNNNINLDTSIRKF